MCKVFVVIEYVVLANKYHLHKLTQNSVFNKIYNALVGLWKETNSGTEYHKSHDREEKP